MNKINKITIVPALFLEKENEHHCMIKCLIGDNKDNPILENRRFENKMIEHIKNPKYIFIGIINGDGFVQLTFKDGNDYADMFEKKWGVLTI